ncbi:MAG TPA: carboxypeptidase regulatory-like domain-containing protein [Nocardioides sp.]|nr:carboxypeptidase regulatory-like domain-containing protein [Nocardioides sp.]
MRPLSMVLVAAAILLSVGCGEQGAAPVVSDSGVAGVVHLGPQCPVETLDDPCDDKPAAGVTVTVSEQLPGEAYAAGETVAQGTTDATGAFRIAVAPGEYVVTADAGMSCELMDARVTEGSFAEVDVPCDTGIR